MFRQNHQKFGETRLVFVSLPDGADRLTSDNVEKLVVDESVGKLDVEKWEGQYLKQLSDQLKKNEILINPYITSKKEIEYYALRLKTAQNYFVERSKLMMSSFDSIMELKNVNDYKAAKERSAICTKLAQLMQYAQLVDQDYARFYGKQPDWEKLAESQNKLMETYINSFSELPTEVSNRSDEVLKWDEAGFNKDAFDKSMKNLENKVYQYKEFSRFDKSLGSKEGVDPINNPWVARMLSVEDDYAILENYYNAQKNLENAKGESQITEARAWLEGAEKKLEARRSRIGALEKLEALKGSAAGENLSEEAAKGLKEQWNKAERLFKLKGKKRESIQEFENLGSLVAELYPKEGERMGTTVSGQVTDLGELDEKPKTPITPEKLPEKPIEIASTDEDEPTTIS